MSTIKRQIDFPAKAYSEASTIMDEDNNRTKKYSRSEKIHMKQMIPILLEDGIKYRRGEIYTPDDMKKDLNKDDKWVSLRAKAELAVENLMDYQKNLIFLLTKAD